MSDSLRPHGLYSPWNSLGQNSGEGSLSPLKGIFPIQGLNPGVLHCRQILYQLSHKGSPRILEWVAYSFFSGSSWPRNQTRVPCIGGRFFTNWATREETNNMQIHRNHVCKGCVLTTTIKVEQGVKDAVWVNGQGQSVCRGVVKQVGELFPRYLGQREQHLQRPWGRTVLKNVGGATRRLVSWEQREWGGVEGGDFKQVWTPDQVRPCWPRGWCGFWKPLQEESGFWGSRARAAHMTSPKTACLCSPIFPRSHFQA